MSNSFLPSSATVKMSAPSALRQRLAKREDSEHEQALLRIAIVGLVLAYMAGFHGWPSTWTAINREIVVVLTGFFAVAVAIFVSICLYPRKNVVRRLVGMLADTGGCTWYMWVAGDYGFAVIGTPSNAPIGLPRFSRRSAAAAADLARSISVATTALSASLWRAYWSRQLSSRSLAETLRARSKRARSSAER